MKRLFIFLFALLFIVGCNNKQQAENNNEEKERIQVYTTVYPLQFFTEQIGGDFVDVQSIYPPGADEHTYEPSQKEMIRLADSDLFFYIGLGLESFAEKAQSTLKNQHVKMVAVTEGLVLKELSHDDDEHHDPDHEHDELENHDHAHDEHQHGLIDPHVWIDPIHAKHLAKQILDTLNEVLPEQKSLFEANYSRLDAQLDALNEKFIEATQNRTRDKIIVAHAAYGYWVERYGIKQIAISGISSVEEPSQKKLKNIIDTVVEQNIPYILFEQNINARLADVVRKEAGAEMLKIHNLAVLTENDIKNGDDYFTLMEMNAEVLMKALH